MKRTVLLSLLSVFSMFVYAQTALEDVPVECIKPNFRAGQTIAFNYSSENELAGYQEVSRFRCR